MSCIKTFKIFSTQAFSCILNVTYFLYILSRTPGQDSAAERIRPMTFCWQDTLFQPSGPACHLTTWSNPPDCSFHRSSADCWYLQLMSTLSRGPYVDVCGESQSCFSRGKFRGIAQSGLSQQQYCLEGEGGWGRRSAAPYTTQLEKDTLWRDWLHI